MHLVGGAWSQFAKYSLWEIPRDPSTMMMMGGGQVLGLAGIGASAAGTALTAQGMLASGQAQQQAGEIDAEAATGSASLAAAAATNSAALSASAATGAASLTAGAALTSSALTAEGQELSGSLAQAEGQFEATQDIQNASTARAEAQRGAFDVDTSTRLALSSLTAKAAGSGLNAGGATTVAVARSIGERGTYLALSEMAQGEATARGLEDSAVAARITGDAAKYGSVLQAMGTIYAGQTTAEAALYSGATTAQSARYTGAATSQADLYQGLMTAAASRLRGDAALTASQYGAEGTIASGTGSALTKAGALFYPTTSGRAGATL